MEFINFKNLNKDKFFIYLFLLLPILLISGPFLSDTVVSVLAIYFFFIIKDNKFILINYFTYIFIFFYFLLLITSFFSYDFLISINTTLPYLRHGLFVLTSTYLLLKFPEYKKFFFFVVIFCFLILLVDGYFQFFYGKNFLGYPYENNRLSSLFGSELILGSYLVRLLPLSIALFLLHYKFIDHKILYLVILFLVSILIIISGERTALAMLLIFIFFSFFLSNFDNKKIYLTFPIFMMAFILVLFFSENLKKRIIYDTLSEIKSQNDTKAIMSNDEKINFLKNNKISNELKEMRKKFENNEFFFLSTAHESAWRISLKMFKKNILTGVGPKMFRYTCGLDDYKVYDRGCANHPHSYYAQMLAENGIFGFLFLTIIFLSLLFLVIINRFFVKKNFLNNYQIILIVSYLTCLFPLMPSGNFLNNWLSITFYLPMPFLIASFYE